MLRRTLAILLALAAAAAGARADEELKATDKPTLHVPDSFKRKHPEGTFYGAYKVCVTPDGKIDSIETLRSIPDADDALTAQIRDTWKYEAPKARACTIEKFSFVMSKENTAHAPLPEKPDGKSPAKKKKKTK